MLQHIDSKVFLSIFILFFLTVLPPTHAQASRVGHVIDGDTFTLQSGEKVRIMGIDAPEMGKENTEAGYYALESKIALRELLSNAKIELKRASKDHYGRTLAIVETGDGDVGEIMVRRGYAWYYPHSDHPLDLGPRLLMAQRQAMENKEGMWRGFISWAQKQGPVVGNRKSWRFFPLGTPSLTKIHPGNRLKFSNQVEAFKAGFVPARWYHQWPNVSDIEIF